MPAATGPRRCRRPTSCYRRPPAIRSIRSRRAAVPCRRAAGASTSPPTASAASPRAISTGCSPSGCANMSASAAPTTSRRSASAGWCAPRRSPRDLGLTFRVDYASDPFFGRVGQMKAVSQIAAVAEIRAAGAAALRGAADRLHELQLSPRSFRHAWGIADAAGEPAHTACVAFGMDRLAVAMFHTHGRNVAGWPTAVRDLLGFPRNDR